MSEKLATPGLLEINKFKYEGWRSVIITSIVPKNHQKNIFFVGWSLFKFNNLALALDMILQYYTSVVKVLKLKFKKFLGRSLTFIEVTEDKLVGRGAFNTPPLWGLFAPTQPPTLKRVKLKKSKGYIR